MWAQLCVAGATAPQELRQRVADDGPAAALKAYEAADVDWRGAVAAWFDQLSPHDEHADVAWQCWAPDKVVSAPKIIKRVRKQLADAGEPVPSLEDAQYREARRREPERPTDDEPAAKRQCGAEQPAAETPVVCRVDMSDVARRVAEHYERTIKLV
jgi:hypothetical protein